MRTPKALRWGEVVFEDLVAHAAFGPRFSGSAYASDGNIATLRTTDLDDDGRISYGTMPLAHLDEGEFANHILSAGDLVITRSGTCGIAAVFEGFHLPVLPGAFLLRFRMTERADARFFRYYFNSPAGRSHILSVARGAVQQNLNITNVKALRVPLPPIPAQQWIVGILSAYDELIENNRRRMALLEDAARQLYREWFVRLRFPGREHTRITNGIPEGWSRAPISTLTTFLNRGIAPHYDDSTDSRVINQKCIRNGRLDITLARGQTREFKPDRQVLPGDVLVNSTGQGTLGRVAQVVSAIPNCTVDTHVTIVRPAQHIAAYYFGMALKELEPRLSTMGRGATNQTELSRGQIGEIELLIPAGELVRPFETFVAPIFRQVGLLFEQNLKLKAARDLLLTCLMSGEVAA